MRRTTVLVVSWLAATAVAVAVAWAGVRLVAAQVVEPLPVAISEVTAAPSPSESPSPGPGPTATPTDAPSAQEPEGPRPTSTGTPAPTSPPDDGAPRAVPETRTYSLVGGTVTIEFTSGAVRVVQATPKNGFTRKVEQESTTDVKVEFRSERHRSRLDAWWSSGPRYEIEEEAESGSDDD